MFNLKELLVRIGADASALEKGLGQAGKSLTNFKNKAKAEVEATSNSMKGLTSALGGLNGILAAVGIGSLAGLVKLTDAYNSLQARIAESTKATGDFAAVSDGLATIAKKTGSSLEATVAVFQRITFAQKEIGASNVELLKFVETASKLGTISGAGPDAMRNGLTQLGQAMSSGVVHAEEFNSILENTPAIGVAAARGLEKAGGSVGKLRQLVIDGKVSSKEFFDAILSQSKEVESQFDKMPLTVGRALGSLGISFQQLLGNLDANLGATNALSNGVNTLSGFLDGAQVAIINTAKTLKFLMSVLGATAGVVVVGVAAAVSGVIGAITSTISSALTGVNRFVEIVLNAMNFVINQANKIPGVKISNVNAKGFSIPTGGIEGLNKALSGTTKELFGIAKGVAKSVAGDFKDFMAPVKLAKGNGTVSGIGSDPMAAAGKDKKGKKKTGPKDKSAQILKKAEDERLKDSLASLKTQLEDSRIQSDRTIKGFGVDKGLTPGSKEGLDIKVIKEQSAQLQREIDLQKAKLAELNAMSFKTVEVDKDRKDAIKDIQQELERLTNQELDNKNKLEEATAAREKAIKAFEQQKQAIQDAALEQKGQAELEALKDENAKALEFAQYQLDHKLIKEKEFSAKKLELLRAEAEKEKELLDSRIGRLRAEQEALGATTDEQLKRMEIENQINQLLEERANVQRDFEGAAFTENLRDKTSNYFDEVKGFLEDFGQKFEDSFINAFKTGKFSIKEFFASFLEDLARLIIKLTITIPMVQALVSLLDRVKGGSGGFSGGGGLLGKLIGGVAGGIFGGGFASGGAAAQGLAQGFTFAAGGSDALPLNGKTIVGEDGPEILDLGGKSGKVIPNHDLGGIAGGSTNLTQIFQIQALDGKSVRDVLGRERPFIQRMAVEGVQQANNKRGKKGPLDRGR